MELRAGIAQVEDNAHTAKSDWQQEPIIWTNPVKIK